MPAGFASSEHDHTEDYLGIVKEGAGVNFPAGSADIALPAKSCWFQRGAEDLVAKCVSDHDCVFYISQPGPFDYVQAK